MSKVVHDFPEVGAIPCFAFNNNATRLAISPNDEKVMIYELKSNKWELTSTLKDHGSRVCAMDWAPNSNKLVTCGADRNSYVWTEASKNDWKPSLVLLRINRAAISVKWSPLENKFAVGTGNKLICICYYENSNDWWVAKHIKKPIRSSVLSVDWHPNSNLVAAGSSDFTVRIFSAALKEVDKKPEPTKWGEKNAFGACLQEFKCQNGGWVHCVKFSPSGDQLCWVGHDSCVSVADATKGEGYVHILKLNTLPLIGCLWLNDSSIIAGGHDNKPYKFSFSNGIIKMDKCIDAAGSSDAPKKELSAMSKFKNLDSMGQDKGNTQKVNSTHLNTIKQFSIVSGGKVASSALDSKIVLWTC